MCRQKPGSSCTLPPPLLTWQGRLRFPPPPCLPPTPSPWTASEAARHPRNSSTSSYPRSGSRPLAGWGTSSAARSSSPVDHILFGVFWGGRTGEMVAGVKRDCFSCRHFFRFVWHFIAETEEKVDRCQASLLGIWGLRVCSIHQKGLFLLPTKKKWRFFCGDRGEMLESHASVEVAYYNPVVLGVYLY